MEHRRFRRGEAGAAQAGARFPRRLLRAAAPIEGRSADRPVTRILNSEF